MSEFFNGTTLDPPITASAPTSLPVIGLTLVIVLCGYLAMKTWNEFRQESSLKSALYEETGINGKYEYSLPVDEMKAYKQVKAFLLFLKANGKPPTEGAKLELPAEKARELLRTKLDDEEKKRIRFALIRWMIGTIDVLARVERDRPGAAKLYEKKLVSEEYWNGVQSCFRDTHETIQLINSEAEFIEEGWSAQIFQQALQLWRVTKVREQQRSESGASTPQQ